MIGSACFLFVFLIGKNGDFNGPSHKQVFTSYKLVGGFENLVLVLQESKTFFCCSTLR